VPTYTVLTTDASPRLAWLHDRMPALLVGDGAVAAWLEGGKMEVRRF
jgi:putative SOS response-associated peptidase YedK